MIIQLTQSLGEVSLRFLNIFYEALYFAYQCLHKLVQKRSYNSAMREILVKQIYFTAIQVLPLILFIGIILGTILIPTIVHFSLEYALKDHIGTFIIHIILNELAPLSLVLLIALRSGAAINTEISVMKVSNELNTLKSFNINIIEYLFLPRILAGIISVTLLTFLLSIIILLSGYIYLFFFFKAGADLYIRTLIHAISMNDFLMLFIKSILFGFFATLIPIYSALGSSKSYTGIPIAVLNGMVKLIIAIISIEVILLLIQY